MSELHDSNPGDRRIATQIVLAAAAGDATIEQFRELSELIRADESVAQHVIELGQLQAQLSGDLIGELANKPNSPGPALLGELGDEEPHANLLPISVTPSSTLSRISKALRSSRLPTIAASLALVGTGIVVGGAGAWWALNQRLPKIAREMGVPNSIVSGARFIEETTCVWSPDTASSLQSGGLLRRGEALNLMEGLATVGLAPPGGGQTELKIEGPARMMLSAEGEPNLSLGKFAATVESGMQDTFFDTPYGQIRVLEDSALGVSIHALGAALHVFSGEIEFVSPWSGDGNTVRRYRVPAGESLVLATDKQGVLEFIPGPADPSHFAALTSMATDELKISPAYVREIVAAKPQLYWRFSDVQQGQVRNEMGASYAGFIQGSPRHLVQGDNGLLEFGRLESLEEPATYIQTEESFGASGAAEYSIEVWVKPSHYQLGTMVSLIHNSKSEIKHGAILELGGPLVSPTSIEHSGRLRFLHRSPPSSDATTGTSCFSQSPYELRRWTHLAAVKDPAEMRVYVNGELLGSAKDNTAHAAEMVLLVGQLDQTRGWRRFIGQLDELAFYQRALSAAEIKRHFQLVRPTQKAPSEAPPQRGI